VLPYSSISKYLSTYLVDWVLNGSRMEVEGEARVEKGSNDDKIIKELIFNFSLFIILI